MADNDKDARREVTERVRESIKRDNAEIAQKQADAARLQQQDGLRSLETDLRLQAQRTAAEKATTTPVTKPVAKDTK